ncbi:MAG: Maf family protein [Gammaproteobacteria bacterium]|nr:Maf family protein [Gammaproteobacteria bacterium]
MATSPLVGVDVQLILATMSPYRREQLQSLGYSFRVVPAHIDETQHSNESAYDLTMRLAQLKAETVADLNPGCVVIGSDQVGVCDSEILTKPGNRENALACLMRYPGSLVRFETAVCVRAPDGKIFGDVVSTTIKFREFTPGEAERYVDLDKPFDCAGAIKSERHAPLLFESVCSDDPSALVGLPLIKTASFLRLLGINPLDTIDASTR